MPEEKDVRSEEPVDNLGAEVPDVPEVPGVRQNDDGETASRPDEVDKVAAEEIEWNARFALEADAVVSAPEEEVVAEEEMRVLEEVVMPLIRRRE